MMIAVNLNLTQVFHHLQISKCYQLCLFLFCQNLSKNAPEFDLIFFTEDDIEEDTKDSETETNEQEIPKSRFVRQPPSLQKLMGHRNARTMIKEATWWGNDYILSGGRSTVWKFHIFFCHSDFT